MRKVITLDESWEFPYSIIEAQDDGYIIDITNPYLTGYDEETGEPLHTEVDESVIGDPATWEDVRNLFLFDLKIGNNLYSWRRKDGFYHIDMKGTKIGLVSYHSVRANGKVQGFTKKTVIPSMLGNPALEIVDGNLSVSGSPYADTEFYDVSTGQMTTLDSIKKVKDDIEYLISFPEPVSEDEL